MTGPDFRDLVGDEGTPEELEKLRRAHELLIAAGPPPELSPRLAEAPPTRRWSDVVSRHRRQSVFALAAAIVAIAFAAGYLIGDRGEGFQEDRSVEMHGTGQLVDAHGKLAIGEQERGNYPLEMTVRGLPALPEGGWYELLLSKQGRPTLSCGPFTVEEGEVTVRLSVPYDLSKWPKLFDGWVVVRHLPDKEYAPVVMRT
jgi:hypothetical protein